MVMATAASLRLALELAGHNKRIGQKNS
jgi:3-carboxy-cis,cis-muconate cycloisomerase